MDAAQVARVTDPFFTTRTTRHVGLGLPLLASAAERCGGGVRDRIDAGSWDIGDGGLSAQQHRPRATGQHPGHAHGLHPGPRRTGRTDSPLPSPVGDVQFEMDTAELRTELDGIPLSHPQVRNWLEGFIAEGRLR